MTAILPQVDATHPLANGSRAMRIAETGSLLVPNLRDPTFATMEIPMQWTGARQLAQSSAASTAPAEQPQRQIGAHKPVATA